MTDDRNLYHEAASRYRVWAESRTYCEEPAQMKCLGMFMFLQEALDYCRYLVGANVTCVLTGPCNFVSVQTPEKWAESVQQRVYA